MSEERLSDLLKGLRKRENLSQEILAAKIGLHRNLVSKYERHPGEMKVHTLEKWCRALGEPSMKVLRYARIAPESVHERN